jgi:hypothetical protein
MKIQRNKIFVALIIICLIFGLLNIIIFNKKYDLNFVDQLVDSIVEIPNESKMEKLLSYKTYHSVDASFSLHYHSCLWVIYEKHPKLFLKYRNGKYKDTIEKVIMHGKEIFTDGYPKGRN